MKNYNYTFYIDLIFFFLVGAIISYPLFNQITTFPFSILCSFCFGIILSFLLSRILVAKFNKKLKNKDEKKKYDDFLLALNLMSKNQLFDFFLNYLTLRSLAFTRTRCGFVIGEKKTCVFLKFGFETVEKVDIVRFYNQTVDGYNIVIIAEDFSEEVKKFASRFNRKIQLIDSKEFFIELKKYQYFPKNEYSLPPEKRTKKIKLENVFKRKNAKNFFAFGVVFLAMSFFVSIKTYYLVSGSVFLIVSVFCILFGKTEQKS